jgi:glycosyltransferase involved in cell wall biosynthesis
VKIGLVNVSQFVGGAERELADQAVAMREDHGISVLAIIDSKNAGLAALLRGCGVQTEAADFQFERDQGATTSSIGNVWRLLQQARKLRAIQRRNALDVLVTYSFHSGIVGAIARLTGMKAKLIVGQLTRRDLTRGGLMEHLQFLGADAVTYNSNALRHSYANVARFYSRPEKVVYSYVKRPVLDGKCNERTRLMAEFGLPADTIVVGYCGHIFKYKRVADVVEAVGLLNATAPGKFFLMVIGGSATPAEYETDVRALAAARCAGRHHFFPFVSDPFSLMAACDVLVQPSVLEPFGRVLIEAMYLGVPFVATDAAGPKEILSQSDPRCGKLVPPARPDAIAEAIRAITNDRRLEHPPVPHALSREGIIGGAVQFYREVVTKQRRRYGQTHGLGLLHGDRSGG